MSLDTIRYVLYTPHSHTRRWVVRWLLGVFRCLSVVSFTALVLQVRWDMSAKVAGMVFLLIVMVLAVGLSICILTARDMDHKLP